MKSLFLKKNYLLLLLGLTNISKFKAADSSFGSILGESQKENKILFKENKILNQSIER